MKFNIGKHDPKTGTVPVAFEHAGVSHEREVNACYDADGKFDARATQARVQQVANGVEHKIKLGVLKNAPAPEETKTDAPEA